jgi:Cu(I)/Ag(I) efflux system protein CusF
MKKVHLALTIIALLFLSSCDKPELKNTEVKSANTVSQSSQTPQAVSTQPKDGNYPSKGKITKINTELGSVELDHEKIVGVMEPMIMEFYVKDKSLLDGLKVGDNVDFVLEYKHPTETIVSIKKIK